MTTDELDGAPDRVTDIAPEEVLFPDAVAPVGVVEL
jgi:hypothetical protein